MYSINYDYMNTTFIFQYSYVPNALAPPRYWPVEYDTIRETLAWNVIMESIKSRRSYTISYSYYDLKVPNFLNEHLSLQVVHSWQARFIKWTCMCRRNQISRCKFYFPNEDDSIQNSTLKHDSKTQNVYFKEFKTISRNTDRFKLY